MRRKKKLANDKRKHVHPSTFMFLYLPFGVFQGYISVTIGFLLTNAGVSLAGVASIVSIPYLPNILKFLWAPLVDTTLTVKSWYRIANIGTAAGIIIMCLLPLSKNFLSLLMVIVLLTSLINTVIAMATEALIAQDVPDELKGQAGGWLQAGNLGGFGLGGGAGIWLTEKLSDPWMAGVIIAGICLICGSGLLKLSEPLPFHREAKYTKTVITLGKDIWTLIKSRGGFLALVLCFIPIGSGAAQNLWSSISNDWSAPPGAVALAVGIFGGIMSAIGCLLGGWICDRMDRKKAYILFGLLESACAASMAFSPRTELMFVLWTSLYAVTVGLAFAGFSAFVLEAIGKTAAATKYNVFAALSNIPIYLMIFVDEGAYAKWNATGILIAETIVPILGALLFISLIYSLNKFKPVPIKQN